MPARGPTAEASHEDTRWTLSTTGAGIALVLTDSAGTELFRLSCARSPAELAIEGHRFRAISSEERLSFGVDDESYVFVADVASPRPIGVHATTAIDTSLLRRLESATVVRAVYGAQTEGPHAPPDSSMRGMFVRTCRGFGGA